jgi:hypothetical protein
VFAPPLASKTTNEQTGGGKLSAAGALVAIARVAAHWLEETKRGVRCKNSSPNYSGIFTSVQLGFAMAAIEVLTGDRRGGAPCNRQEPIRSFCTSAYAALSPPSLTASEGSARDPFSRESEMLCDSVRD